MKYLENLSEESEGKKPEKRYLSQGVVSTALLGIIIILASLIWWRQSGAGEDEPPIEIIRPTKTESITVVVEAAGEVEKPGVYHLAAGSRVSDLLAEAGGLAAAADREWVARNINKAEKLLDGQKIFIPRKGQTPEPIDAVSGKINLNQARAADLEDLPGVGATTAEKIISNRPYRKVEELVEKKIVNSKVWGEIKEKVTVSSF